MTNEERYIISRWAYAIGEEYINDMEYDRLEVELKNSNLLPEYTSRGWSEDPCPYGLLQKYNLDEFIVPVEFSFKTESIESLNNVTLIEDKFSYLNVNSRLSIKLDGFSLRLNYFNGTLVSALLRNRNEGKVVSLVNLMSMFQQTITLKGKVLVCGELYLKNNTLEQYKLLRGVTSQRSGVSTAIANGDVEFVDYRCYSIYYDGFNSKDKDSYLLLQELGFSVPKNLNVKDYKTLLKGIDLLSKLKPTFKYPSDGLVLENETTQNALRVGAWEEEINKSYVTGYEFNRGMYGDSILCTIKPVNVNQKTVTLIAVTNLQTIIDNNLRIGYPIVFVERSGVNSVIDTDNTAKVQQEYIDKYDVYRDLIDSL